MPLKIALAQINTTVGDVAGNSAAILQSVAAARKARADVIVFPELAICGYPPEDLLLKDHFVAQNLKALQAIAKKVHDIAAIVGFVDSDGSGKIYNAAALVCDGEVKGVAHKQELPNYGVFDEKRYFTAGTCSGIFEIKGKKVGINICEDIWIDGSVHNVQAKSGAKVLINISCSPYEAGKLGERAALLSRRAKENKVYVVYANMVGGQDELVFDGGSMVFSPEGNVIALARQFEEELLIVDLSMPAIEMISPTGNLPAPLGEDEEMYRALVLGTRDYVRKNGFTDVAIGLSGGVDSALIAAIAVDALGREHVTGVSMPSQFNVKATRADAAKVAKNLGIRFIELPIKKLFDNYLKALKPWFDGTTWNIAEENVQARVRGTLLMAFANKFNWLVLTTGNKSEMAVGYCTLYGDMSGGFAPLKDIFKTKVYALCRWRNGMQQDPLIPKSVLMRAPSAELRNDQTDEESLGAYELLDQVLLKYIEGCCNPAQIANDELPLDYVRKVITLVDRSEYKRRQAPPGIKITARAFGKDWRLPITNKYKES